MKPAIEKQAGVWKMFPPIPVGMGLTYLAPQVASPATDVPKIATHPEFKVWVAVRFGSEDGIAIGASLLLFHRNKKSFAKKLKELEHPETVAAYLLQMPGLCHDFTANEVAAWIGNTLHAEGVAHWLESKGIKRGTAKHHALWFGRTLMIQQSMGKVLWLGAAESPMFEEPTRNHLRIAA